MNPTPPRLLAGAIAIIWGGLTGNTSWGLLAAFFLESRSWVHIRWDFNRGSYIRAWHFSILIAVLIALLAWINGVKASKLHTLFVWAPLILLPVELAQRYGKAAKIPLNTFSFFARKKMDRDIEQGRYSSPRMVNTGYLYIAVVILSTAAASKHDTQHFIGLSLMTALCLFFYVRKDGFRPWAWFIALTLSLSLGFAGQSTIAKLYHHFTGARSDGDGHRTHANESRTSIGKLGKLKLSPKIFWRMSVHEGNVPALMRTAVYNRYSRTRWTHEFIPAPGGGPLHEGDYTDDIRITIFQDRDTRTFSQNTELNLSEKGDLSIVGEVDSNVKNNPIPLPSNMLALGDLGDEPLISRNSLGTIRIGNPENHIINYTVWLGEGSTTEDIPVEQFDLNIPPQERSAITRIANQLGLKKEGLSTREKINILRDFFSREFQYTTHLQTPRVELANRSNAVGVFLEDTRAGHCEYFATATALLLREAGIPTRYCVGFSVNEHDHDREEWVMRGHHAHAWCRVWIQEKNIKGEMVSQWEDLDLTPSSWHQMDILRRPDWQRKLIDWWQRVREDFLIWRTRDVNKTKVAIVVGTIITLLLIWIGWRLWHSRQLNESKKRRTYHRPKNTPYTSLHKLEPLIAKKIGIRPGGVPLCRWALGIINIHPEVDTQLHRITKLHSQLRFDPVDTPKGSSDELEKLTNDLRRVLKEKRKND